jgi:hypothetical protein
VAFAAFGAALPGAIAVQGRWVAVRDSQQRGGTVKRIGWAIGLFLGGILAGIDGAVMVLDPYRVANTDVVAALIVAMGLALLVGSWVALLAGWIVWRSPQEYVAAAEGE